MQNILQLVSSIEKSDQVGDSTIGVAGGSALHGRQESVPTPCVVAVLEPLGEEGPVVLRLEETLGEPMAQPYPPLLQGGGFEPRQRFLVSWVLQPIDDAHASPLHSFQPLTLLPGDGGVPYWHRVLKASTDEPAVQGEHGLEAESELFGSVQDEKAFPNFLNQIIDVRVPFKV